MLALKNKLLQVVELQVVDLQVAEPQVDTQTHFWLNYNLTLMTVCTWQMSFKQGEILMVGDLRIPASAVTVVKEAPLIVTENTE